MGKEAILKYIEDTKESKNCDLDYTEIEDSGIGGIELFCRSCGNSILADNIADAKEGFDCLGS